MLRIAAAFRTIQPHGRKVISVKGHQTRCHALLTAARELGHQGMSFPDFLREPKELARFNPDIVFYDGDYEYVKMGLPGKKVAIFDVPAKAMGNFDLFLFPTPGSLGANRNIPYIMDFMITSQLRENMRGAWQYDPSRRKALFIERGNPELFWRYMAPVKAQCLLEKMDVEVIAQDATIPQLVLLNRMLTSSVVMTTASTTAKEALFIGVPVVVTATHESQNPVMKYMLDYDLGSTCFDKGAVPAALRGEGLVPKEIVESFMLPKEIVQGVIEALELNARPRKVITA